MCQNREKIIKKWLDVVFEVFPDFEIFLDFDIIFSIFFLSETLEITRTLLGKLKLQNFAQAWLYIKHANHLQGKQQFVEGGTGDFC